MMENKFDNFRKFPDEKGFAVDDYVDEEGLICCGMCGGRKQKRFYAEVLNKEMVVTIPCPCEQERRAQEEAKRKMREHDEQVDRLKDVCFINPAMRAYTFDNAANVNTEVMDMAKYFVEHWSDMKKVNAGYLFWGGVGNGKTYTAACIANALMEQEVPVLMRNMSYFMNSSFEDRSELIRSISSYGLLIIDDFGMERSTEFGMEIVFDVIDARYASKKPTIITTNLSMNTLCEPKDLAHQRIYDRVREMCIPIQFQGKSIRSEIQKNKLDEFKNMYCDADRGGM